MSGQSDIEDDYVILANAVPFPDGEEAPLYQRLVDWTLTQVMLQAIVLGIALFLLTGLRLGIGWSPPYVVQRSDMLAGFVILLLGIALILGLIRRILKPDGYAGWHRLSPSDIHGKVLGSIATQFVYMVGLIIGMTTAQDAGAELFYEVGGIVVVGLLLSLFSLSLTAILGTFSLWTGNSYHCQWTLKGGAAKLLLSLGVGIVLAGGTYLSVVSAPQGASVPSGNGAMLAGIGVLLIGVSYLLPPSGSN